MNRSKNYSPPAIWLRGLLLLALVAGVDSCSSDPVDLSPVDPGGGTGTRGSGAQGHGPELVDLGTAGTYVILAKEATTNVPTSDITGNIGLSPAAASFYSGFAQELPAGGAFSTSPQVTGNVYASDYAVPTPANLTTAIGDMETAYTDAAGRPLPDHIELASGNLGGLTLPAGLYKWSNTVTIPGNVTLNGNANDVWIFQIAGGVTQASAARVMLTGGALAEHVFWQVPVWWRLERRPIWKAW